MRSAHPEFKDLPDSQIQTAIDAADRRVSTTLYGARTDDAVRLLTAHLLTKTPFGKDARLTERGKQGSSIYYEEFRRLERQAAATASRVL
jgi:hypothetical protein